MVAQAKSRPRLAPFGATVPVGGAVVFQVGRWPAFRIVEANTSLTVILDNGEEFPFDVGMEYRCEEGDEFSRLEIRNRGNVTLVVSLYVCRGQIADDRLNVVRERGTLPVMEVATQTFGQAGNSIAAFSALDLPGTPTGRQVRRKSVVISNLDIASYLVVKDQAGNRCNVVFPSTTIALFVSGPLSIANETAQPITAYVSETFFMAPE